jgi:Neutral/alkaline non-lysosomal ceramidase, N-terminal
VSLPRYPLSERRDLDRLTSAALEVLSQKGFSMRYLAVIASIYITSPLDAAEFSVGMASVDISPVLGKKPVYMAGFGTNRVATKIHDPIMARAVVMSDGVKKLAFVSVDLVGLFRENVENVRASLKGFDYVMITSTHNHEGPDTLGLWGRSPFTTGVDPDYLKLVEAGCVKAIQDAENKRLPASVKIGTAKGPYLLHDARLPIVKHDDIVTLEFLDIKTGKPTGILVQWNCHPETLDSKNTEISADFVCETIKILELRRHCPVAYFTGTVGGLMTSLNLDLNDPKLKDGTFEKTDVYGLLVANLAHRAILDGQAANLTPFVVKTKTILMPVENNLYRIAKQAGVLNRPMYAYHGNTTPTEWTLAVDVTKPVGIQSEVGYLRLGELEIAALPGEIYPELVLGKVVDPAERGADFPDAPREPAIYANLTAKHKMLFGLANDQLGYFIPKRQWDSQPPYCYGRKSSQYGEINSVGPDAASVICNTFRDLVTPAEPRK